MIHVNVGTAMLIIPFQHPVLLSDQLDDYHVGRPRILKLHLHPAQTGYTDERMQT